MRKILDLDKFLRATEPKLLLRRFKSSLNNIFMIKNRGYYLLAGYSLIVLGISALAMQLVGVQWAFLQFLEWGGGLFAFVSKALMIIAGVLTIVFASTDWERERQDSSE
jgi:hypothetical protein